jgi:hypothetical protein
MLRFALLISLLSSMAFASAVQLTELKAPKGVKTGAAFNEWQRIYTPNFCFLKAFAFRVERKSASDSWESVIEQAAKLVSDDVKKVTSLTKLESAAAVKSAADRALKLEGMLTKNSELDDKLVRVWEKKKERAVYSGETTDGGDASLEGHFIAITDDKENELILLVHGDGMPILRCDQ